MQCPQLYRRPKSRKFNKTIKSIDKSSVLQELLQVSPFTSCQSGPPFLFVLLIRCSIISSNITKNGAICIVLLVPKSFLDVIGQVSFKICILFSSSATPYCLGLLTRTYALFRTVELSTICRFYSGNVSQRRPYAAHSSTATTEMVSTKGCHAKNRKMCYRNP